MTFYFFQLFFWDFPSKKFTLAYSRYPSLLTYSHLRSMTLSYLESLSLVQLRKIAREFKISANQSKKNLVTRIYKIMLENNYCFTFKRSSGKNLVLDLNKVFEENSSVGSEKENKVIPTSPLLEKALRSESKSGGEARAIQETVEMLESLNIGSEYKKLNLIHSPVGKELEDLEKIRNTFASRLATTLKPGDVVYRTSPPSMEIVKEVSFSEAEGTIITYMGSDRVTVLQPKEKILTATEIPQF